MPTIRKKITNLPFLMIFVILLSGVISPTLPAFSGVIPPPAPVIDFGTIQTLDGSVLEASNPQIAVSGSLVWIVWVEGSGADTKIMLNVSTDGGENFSSEIDLTQTVPESVSLKCESFVIDFDCRGLPKVAALGNDAFVVWQDDDDNIPFDFDGQVYYRKINYDSGSDTLTFTPDLSSNPIQITAPNSDTWVFGGPSVAAISTFVHVAWVGPEPAFGGDTVYHARSIDGGSSFTGTISDLSPTLDTEFSFANFPSLALDGSNVYVVWEDYLDQVNPTSDILFSASSDNGDTFNGGTSGAPGAPINLANDGLGGFDIDPSTNPVVAAANGNFYVAWEDVDDVGLTIETHFRHSSDGGATFDPDLSSTPDILSSSSLNSITPQLGTNSDGSRVYVAWEEDGDDDILFVKSTDSGDSFDLVQTLSTGTDPDSFPKLDSLDDNVYLTWIRSVSGDDILKFISSSDGGDTFSSVQDISLPGSFASSQQIDSASVHVVWLDSSNAGDILTRSGDFSTSSLSWDKPDYRLGDTAIITATTTAGLGTLDVDVTSNVDPGFGVTLIETLTPGTYTGSITFATDASVEASGILKVEPDGTITVSSTGFTPVNANIFPRTLTFEFTTSYAKGSGGIGVLPDKVLIIVNDEHSNNPADVDEIIVTVSSDGGDSIDLTLRETGANTAEFRNDNLIFTTGVNEFPVDSSIQVTQVVTDNPPGLTTNDIIDTIEILVQSTTTNPGFLLTLTENGPNTGEFAGDLSLVSSGISGGNTIVVSEGDILSATFGGETENAIIIPNSNPRVGVLQALIGDTVTATWKDAEDDILITTAGAPGGGSGGISRAGFVVNIVAGLGGSIGGGSGGNSPPSFGKSLFAIISGGEEGFGGILNDNNVNTLEETKTFKVGEKAVLRFDFIEGGGIGKIEHIGLYTNVRDGQKRQDSNAYIYFDPLKSPPVSLHDANGLFSEANFELLPTDTAADFVLKFEFIFAKPMAKSDLILESWNLQKWSTLTKISNAIEVIPSEIVETSATKSEPKQVETFLEDITDDKVVPIWVKTNAKWWADGTIDNKNFISGIEYLVNEGIITVSLPNNVNPTVSELQPWIKSTAGWWADDMISEDEFISAIEWLILNDIIRVA